LAKGLVDVDAGVDAGVGAGVGVDVAFVFLTVVVVHVHGRLASGVVVAFRIAVFGVIAAGAYYEVLGCVSTMELQDYMHNGGFPCLPRILNNLVCQGTSVDHPW